MFSVRSCSAAEIHILLPVSRYVPSPAGTACVVMSPSDEPACGSDSAIVPKNRPSIIGFIQRSRCASSPNAASRCAAPIVRNAYAFAEPFAALKTMPAADDSVDGNCKPPSSATNVAPMKPASTYARTARLSESGVATLPPSSRNGNASSSAADGAK